MHLPSFINIGNGSIIPIDDIGAILRWDSQPMKRLRMKHKRNSTFIRVISGGHRRKDKDTSAIMPGGARWKGRSMLLTKTGYLYALSLKLTTLKRRLQTVLTMMNLNAEEDFNYTIPEKPTAKRKLKLRRIE